MDTSIKKKAILILILMIALPLASSQIIGGEIIQSGSINPSWQNVFVYDINNPSNYREVQVSPDQLRYSFSNVNIMVDGEERLLFPQDAILVSEILDFKNSLMAGPVEVNLSHENNNLYSCTDCDIFPRMELREAVQFVEPIKEVYISNELTYILNLNVYDDCDSYFFQNNTYEKFCERGCDYDENKTASLGENEFYLVTDCSIGKRLKSATRPMDIIDIGEHATYQKTIASKNGEITINFFGEKTSGVNKIVDFTPDDYEIYDISNNGIAYDEDGYYAIEWKNVSGEEFNFSYKIKPKENLFGCEMGIEGSNKIKNSMSYDLENLSMADITNKKFYMDCNFSNKISFYMFDEIDFQRKYQKLKKDKVSKIELELETPYEINSTMKEYIPKEFEISGISNSGYVEESNSNYNVITWEVSGDKTEFSYNLKPDESGKFDIFTELGGSLISEEEISVSIFKISKQKGSSSSNSISLASPSIYKYVPENFSIVSPNAPIIIQKDNLIAAFYSKLFNDHASFNLYEFLYEGKYNRTLDYLKSYNIESNLNSTEKAGAKFEYEINKTLLEKNNYKGIRFFTRRGGGFSPITGNIISSTDNSIIYGFESNESISELFIFAEKSRLSIWDKILMFFDSLSSRFSRK